MSDTGFDLATASSVPLSVVETRSDGSTNAGVSPVWSSSDEAQITLTDHGDGTVTAVRVQAGPGSAVVTAVVTNPDGSTVSGTLTLTLGDATPPPPPPAAVTDVAIVPGTPS